MSYVGVDIGGTKVLVTTENVDGYTVSTKTPTSFQDLLRSLDLLISDIGVTSIEGIGVGIPGVVLPSGRCWAPNAGAINDVALTAELNQRWGAPVVVANDAKMALMAETTTFPTSQADPVILVAVGTGIGGAIKVGDTVLDGYQGTAGSFGWLRMKTDTGWKPWEAVASGRALDGAAQRLGLSCGRDLVMMARQGHQASMKAVDGWIDNLANGIASLISIMDPELVLLTGGVTAHGEWFIERIREVVAEAASPLTRSASLELCRYGPESVARGALVAIAQQMTGGSLR